MDDRTKAKIFVFSFLVFVVIAAAMISNSRENITGGVVAEDCEIECKDHDDCDDRNDATLDGCAYPGTCASRCFNEYQG